MSGLDRKTLVRFLELAGERLEGRWVIIGGAVLHLLGAGTRVTMDIDVAGPEDAGMDQALVLMEVAEEIGLPVEAINQAGSFFLTRIEGWREHLVEVHRGTTAEILVPDATLFLLLKLGRLSEADLGDCLDMLDYARGNDQAFDEARVIAALEADARGDAPEGRRARLRQLLAALRRD